MNLWECYVGDDGSLEWLQLTVIKETAKRLYTKPYISRQLCNTEVNPYFDKATLLRDGEAFHRSPIPGLNPAVLLACTDEGKRKVEEREAEECLRVLYPEEWKAKQAAIGERLKALTKATCGHVRITTSDD